VNVAGLGVHHLGAFLLAAAFTRVPRVKVGRDERGAPPNAAGGSGQPRRGARPRGGTRSEAEARVVPRRGTATRKGGHLPKPQAECARPSPKQPWPARQARQGADERSGPLLGPVPGRRFATAMQDSRVARSVTRPSEAKPLPVGSQRRDEVCDVGCGRGGLHGGREGDGRRKHARTGRKDKISLCYLGLHKLIGVEAHVSAISEPVFSVRSRAGDVRRLRRRPRAWNGP